MSAALVFRIASFRSGIEEGKYSKSGVERILAKYLERGGVSSDVKREIEMTEAAARRYFERKLPPKAKVTPPTPMAPRVSLLGTVRSELTTRVASLAGSVSSLLSNGMGRALGWLLPAEAKPEPVKPTPPAVAKEKVREEPKISPPVVIEKPVKEVQFEEIERPPIGIFNDEGNTCFIASALQLILKDPALTAAIIDDALNSGDSHELGEFLLNYQEAQKEQTPVHGVNSVRATMARLSGQSRFAKGQWESNEVLRSVISNENSSLFKSLEDKGYFVRESVRRYYTIPDGYQVVEGDDLHWDDSLGFYSEQVVSNPGFAEILLSNEDENVPLGSFLERFFSENDLEGAGAGVYMMTDLVSEMPSGQPCEPRFSITSWDRIPDLIRLNLGRWNHAMQKVTVPVQVEETMKVSIGGQEQTLQVIGFTKHGGTTQGGHWISYTMVDGHYYELSDQWKKEITQAEYLKAAQLGSEFVLRKS